MAEKYRWQHLRRLVEDKNRWSMRLTDDDRARGFAGWHERGYLPHCDFPGLIQFVTFRLGDSMPASRRGEWEHLLKIENVRERRAQLEQYLDRGVGACHLRDPRIAQLSVDVIRFFDQKRYALLAWCVMPNHIHALLHVWHVPLGKIMQSWKRRIATQAEPILGATKVVDRSRRKQTLNWEREYWDTYMRNSRHLNAAIRYTEVNPVDSRLTVTAKEWQFSSARFRDEYNQLVLP